MQGFNHVAGGLAFTGIFASADINLFSKPEYIAVTVAASLLADVDHTRSIPGKIFYPLAKWLDKKYGHRTVTHCLLFYLAAVAVVGIFEMLLFPGQRVYTLFFALGYGSHLIFDMCTRQGIPLFMPFTRARCVLPGNPNLRLSNKNITGEIVVFFGFAGLRTFSANSTGAKM
jgi:inner membrane protein